MPSIVLIFPFWAALLLAAAPAWSQLTIDTVAGGKLRSGVSANDVLLKFVRGMSWDRSGNLALCETPRNVIRRIRSDGLIETIAGDGTTGFTPDGKPALESALNEPVACSYDAAGNLYFSDSRNYRIRRVNKEGVLSTIAGNGLYWTEGMAIEGPATSVALGLVYNLAVSGDGVVYFSSYNYANGFIARVTVAGRVEVVTQGEGNLAVDGQGNLFVTVQRNTGGGIRRIAPDGTVTEWAGNGDWETRLEDDENKPAADIYIDSIASITADHQGNVYLVQLPAFIPRRPTPTRIRRIDTTGTIRTLATSELPGSPPSGVAVLPFRGTPGSLASDARGNLAFADDGYPLQTIQLLTAELHLSTLAGATPKPAPDGMRAREAWFLEPSAIAINAAGELFIAEMGACLIRKIGSDGVLRTFAGTGKCAASLPGSPATGTDLPPPVSLAVDSRGRLYMADTSGHSYAIAPSGSIAATALPPGLSRTRIAIDRKDRLYALDDFSLKRISEQGEVQWIVRPPSQPGVPPPGFGPTSLEALGVDSRGSVYFSGTYLGSPASYVFRVEDDGIVTKLYERTFGSTSRLVSGSTETLWLGGAYLSLANLPPEAYVGRGPGYSGDGGPLQQAHLEARSMALNSTGDLFLLDGERVRRVTGRTTTNTPTIAAVVNAVSYMGGAIAPGELISIFGSNFGIERLIVNAPENNRLSSVAGRTKVLFGGNPALISAVTPNQINVFAPIWLEPGKAADIIVMVDTTTSAPFSVSVAATAPGVLGTILNQDGSPNSRALPAPRGSIVTLFGTGGGPLVPSPVWDSLILSPPYPLIEEPVKVTIGGFEAEVAYAGAAPLQPSGIFQINARVPQGIAAGDAAVSVSIGNVAARAVTLAVR